MDSTARKTGSLLARPPLGILVLVGIELLLGLLFLVGPVLPGSLPDAAFWNLNAERSIGTWFSTTQLALLGVMLLALALARRRPARWPAVAFALGGLVALFLSLDEQARLHERFARVVDSLTAAGALGLDRSGPWMLVVAPALLLVLAGLAFAARPDFRGRRHVAWLLAGGAALFVAAFAGMEVVRNFVGSGSVADTALGVVEELGEMLGVTLMIWAVYELMRSHDLHLLARGPGSATR